MSSRQALKDLAQSVSEAESIEERFQRFVDGIDEDDKAEFIDGEVVLHSPAMPRHIRVEKRLLKILEAGLERQIANGLPIGEIAIDQALCRFDKRNAFMPDLSYWGPEKAESIQPDELLFPIPDFIVEILSEATYHNDTTVKLDAYARHGVKEYWIIHPAAGTEKVERFLLTPSGHTYQLQPRAEYLHVSIFPGFHFPEAALFSDTECDSVITTLWRAEIEPPLLLRIEAEKKRAEEAEMRAEAALLEIERLKEKSFQTARTLLQAGVEKTRVAELTELSLDEIDSL